MAKTKIEIAWRSAYRVEAEGDCRRMVAFFVPDRDIRVLLKQTYGCSHGVASTMIKKIRKEFEEELKVKHDGDLMLAENIQVTKAAISLAGAKGDLSALKFLIEPLSKITGVSVPRGAKKASAKPEESEDEYEGLSDEELLKASGVKDAEDA